MSFTVVDLLAKDEKCINGQKVTIREMPALPPSPPVYVLTIDEDPEEEPIATCHDPERLASWAWRYCAWEVRLDCDLSKVAR